MDPRVVQFPALKVHEDGSLGVLEDISYWEKDVDQWYWSQPGEYLIDSLAGRFDQKGPRCPDGTPYQVPEWSFSGEIDSVTLVTLAEVAPDPPISLAEFKAIEGRKERVAFLMEVVRQCD